ncbi:phosphoribosylanthranilate isomerase [Paenibacillus chartarius]|uniref:N-(5'-phosphoribosyl)anthranilate isomerase n=1 Tax=Paenibacillus chartarius TaxID=747481 RepID=A0ABV6DQB4_9BACL
MATVKICGVRTPETVRELRRLSVDHIGFVFAKSKRQVSAEEAGALIRELHDGVSGGESERPLAVGVFVDPSMEQLEAIMDKAPLDVIQLHGSESPELCAAVKQRIGVRVFKAVSLERESRDIPSAENIAGRLDRYRGAVDAILLDTHDPVYGGGSGTTFAWECIPPYQVWAREAGVQLLVAGGLTPDNVDNLVSSFGPDGVDVSSGVETEGTKDLDKIRKFVERVKRS